MSWYADMLSWCGCAHMCWYTHNIHMLRRPMCWYANVLICSYAHMLSWYADMLYVDVLVCWYANLLMFSYDLYADVLICWSADVVMFWCSDVLMCSMPMCWYADMLSADVLMCSIALLICWNASMLLYAWPLHLLCCPAVHCCPPLLCCFLAHMLLCCMYDNALVERTCKSLMVVFVSFEMVPVIYTTTVWQGLWGDQSRADYTLVRLENTSQ